MILPKGRLRRILRLPFQYPNSSSFNPQSVLRKELNGFHVGPVLFREDTIGENVRSVVEHHRNELLDYDWTGIIVLIHEVYSSSGDLHTSLDSCFVNVVTVHALAKEHGDQGRVHVHDLVAVGFYDR
jgi:hypothetical protein